LALELTTATRRALKELAIEPNLTVKFEGLDLLFSTQALKEYITIGCPGFFIGADGYFIGGLKDISPDLNKTIVDSQSTTWSIRQQINYDEGKSNSISTMTIGLVDKDQIATQLITPGDLVEELMGRKAQVFVNFGETSFFEDAVEIFKGFVTSIESDPGLVKIKLNHPDNKKNVNLFQSRETKLTSAINSTATTLAVEDASTFIEPSGPVNSYLRIGTELIQFDTIVGNTFTGVSRGALGSLAQPHALDDQVKAVYSMEGNPLDLAMELMMSGHGTDPVHENITVSSFVQVGAGANQIPNAIYFDQINIVRDFGLRAGDTITTTGAINASNNVTAALVEDVIQSETGYYVLVDGANFTLELDSTAVMATFTQYNTMPQGMRMTPDEVDINEHIKIRDFFHSSTQMQLFIKEDKIEGKKFIFEQLYRPIACYELPRKSQASVGYTVGPIPGEDIVTLDETNVKNPRTLRIIRTTARGFFNEVAYSYDDTPLIDEERFLTGKIFISQESKDRIKGGNRTYEIPSIGLKTNLNAENIAASNSQRLIDRYKFAAETVKCKAKLSDTAGIEVGDIVVGDFEELQVSDITKGSRAFEPRLFEVRNRTLNLKTGDVELEMMDTGINIDTRFGLISPCSLIGSVVSTSQFVIKPSPLYPSKFGLDEYRKWEAAIRIREPMAIRVHNEDYTVDEQLVVTDISENTFTLRDPATITLTEDLIVEFAPYDNPDTSNRQKLLYAYMTDDPTFGDGGNQYSMI